MNNRSVPISTVLPHVVYQSVPEACDWLSRVFGFSEHYRYGQPVSGVQITTLEQSAREHKSWKSFTRRSMAKGNTESMTLPVTAGSSRNTSAM
jgi:hypothetical protein